MKTRTTTRPTNSGSSPSTETAIDEALAQGLRPGDSLTLSSGREVFPMPDGGSFEVGPVTATVLMREGDTAVGVYKRARGLVEVLFQADFAMKKVAHVGRRGELDAS